MLDRDGWYPPDLDFPYVSPNTASAVVNYKRGAFTITPALTFNQGVLYGNPADVIGLDPRTCTGNSHRMAGEIAALNPVKADYTTCALADTQSGTSPGTLFIPNPTTGSFDSFGAFRQPSQLNLSLTTSYAVTPRIKLEATLANLVNSCFGGTPTPWRRQYPPNAYTCGYIANAYYVSNFYNGTSPNDRKANGVPLNPAFAQPYIPAWADPNAFVVPNPLNAYFQVSVQL